MDGITLYHFPSSHYNEKARWALERKGVAHQRVALLPGPHAPRMLRLSGKTQTPVLCDGDTVVAGSAEILEHLERRFPEPALFPDDAGQRERALAIAREFDDEVGPAVRLAVFFEVMSADYAIETFAAEKAGWVKAAYRASFPVVGRVMRRKMRIDAEGAERGRERTRRALDFVAKEGAGGPLVGGRFGIADLTCAALLMPTVDVSEFGGPKLARNDALREWLARWSDHPGAAWVREIYRRHRREGVGG